MASVEAVFHLTLSLDEVYAIFDLVGAQEGGGETQPIYDALKELLQD